MLKPNACADGMDCTVIPLMNAKSESATTRRRKMPDITGSHIRGHRYELK